jgi:heme/copper-type cytochrome/quinol oxidase subunit 4
MNTAGLAITRAWFALVALSVLVFALIEGEAPARVATIAIVVIAVFKVRLVFLYFMELAAGAMPWRRVATIWMTAVLAILIGLYTYSAGA